MEAENALKKIKERERAPVRARRDLPARSANKRVGARSLSCGQSGTSADIERKRRKNAFSVDYLMWRYRHVQVEIAYKMQLHPGFIDTFFEFIYI